MFLPTTEDSESPLVVLPHRSSSRSLPPSSVRRRLCSSDRGQACRRHSLGQTPLARMPRRRQGQLGGRRSDSLCATDGDGGAAGGGRTGSRALPPPLIQHTRRGDPPRWVIVLLDHRLYRHCWPMPTKMRRKSKQGERRTTTAATRDAAASRDERGARVLAIALGAPAPKGRRSGEITLSTTRMTRRCVPTPARERGRRGEVGET